MQPITDNIHIKPNKLYIIPENKAVTTTDGILQLSERSREQKKNDVIDLFFSSLGIVHQSYAVGIVLSGALSDGTIGLQVIKSYGCLTFAQDGGTAAFNSMPNSAVKPASSILCCLPPASMNALLILTGHSGPTARMNRCDPMSRLSNRSFRCFAPGAVSISSSINRVR